MNSAEKISFKEDFKKLLIGNPIGFYECIEITTIFLHEKNSSNFINLLTIATFEEEKLPDDKSFEITPRLMPVNEKYNLGIFRHYETIKSGYSFFLNLLFKNEWQQKGNGLKINDLTPISKQFIPPDEDIPLNKILKNNFEEGSYLVEFFDETKLGLEFLYQSLKLVDKINEIILNLLPINLKFIIDRVGNIIFQFPVKLFSSYTHASENFQEQVLFINWSPKVSIIPHYDILITNNYDKSIYGFGIDSSNSLKGNPHKIDVSNVSFGTICIIYSSQLNLIYSYKNSNFIKEIDLRLRIQNDELGPRTVNIPTVGGDIRSFEIKSAGFLYNEKHLSREYSTHIEQRIYDNDTKELENDLKFKQYGIVKLEYEPLDDIRTLIVKYGEEGTFIWDPFLSYKDILETLYFNPYPNSDLRALGSFDKEIKKVYTKIFKPLQTQSFIEKIRVCYDYLFNKNSFTDEFSYENWKSEQANGLKNNSNNINLSIEFRCQMQGFGWKFHDRFLIFPSKFSRPKVWSLGTSINSFGKDHHILQEVKNAQNIINAFEDLWLTINNDECKIFKLS